MPVSSESVTEGVVFFTRLTVMSVWGGARMSAVKVLLHVRCSDLGFVKRLPEMCLVARPLNAHNRRSRAFFDWFVDGAQRGGLVHFSTGSSTERSVAAVLPYCRGIVLLCMVPFCGEVRPSCRSGVEFWRFFAFSERFR